MSLIDQIKDGVQRFLPAKSGLGRSSTSGGISGGRGMVQFGEDVNTFTWPLVS